MLCLQFCFLNSCSVLCWANISLILFKYFSCLTIFFLSALKSLVPKDGNPISNVIFNNVLKVDRVICATTSTKCKV